MAMGTTTTQNQGPPAAQRPTQGVTPGGPPTGVGMMGPAPTVPVGPPAEPVLFQDIDPVLLVRLYPEGKSAEELRTMALAAGRAVRDLGEKLVASQQEPVVGAGGEPPVPPAPPPEPHQPPHK